MHQTVSHISAACPAAAAAGVLLLTCCCCAAAPAAAAPVLQTLCNQTVELVFTAHPTQAFRQSLLKKYAKVRGGGMLGCGMLAHVGLQACARGSRGGCNGSRGEHLVMQQHQQLQLGLGSMRCTVSSNRCHLQQAGRGIRMTRQHTSSPQLRTLFSSAAAARLPAPKSQPCTPIPYHTSTHIHTTAPHLPPRDTHSPACHSTCHSTQSKSTLHMQTHHKPNTPGHAHPPPSPTSHPTPPPGAPPAG